MYNQSVKDREDNFITYRDVRTFKSIHTGQESCLGNKKWLEMMDVEPKNPNSKQLLDQFFEFWASAKENDDQIEFNVNFWFNTRK